MDRQYTRLDEVRQVIDPMLAEIGDEETKRCAFVHLYGVGLMAAVLALKRGFDRRTAELAEITGLLHDLPVYTEGADRKGHAHVSARYAREKVLERLDCFTEEEKDRICRGIDHHSDKQVQGDPFDEIIKDADVAQHILRNPAEDYDREKEREKAQKVLMELTGS